MVIGGYKQITTLRRGLRLADKTTPGARRAARPLILIEYLPGNSVQKAAGRGLANRQRVALDETRPKLKAKTGDAINIKLAGAGNQKLCQ